MISTRAYKKSRVIVGADWQPLIIPFNCNYFGLRNVGPDGIGGSAASILMRSDCDDATTEDELISGSQDGLTAMALSGKSRFTQGECLLYLKSANTSPQILIVTWVD